jgi:lipopolysaccharide export system protein LptA
MQKLFSCLAAGILFLVWSPGLFGAAPQVRPVFEDFSWTMETQHDLQIEADQMTAVDDGNRLHLSGNVRVSGTAMDIRSDEADLFIKEERSVFFGNVRAIDGKRVLLSERLELDQKAARVLIERAVILMKKEPLSGTTNQCATAAACESNGRNDLYLRGEKMERREERYQIDKVRFTTCDCSGEKPTWEIRASSADVLPNERVWMKWPIFYAKGLPVFVLPVAYLPLSQRRTGLLFPQVNYSGRDGVVLSDSLFVTLGSSADTTLSLDWFQDRGPRERLEFRIRPSATSSLETRLGFIQDHKAILASTTRSDGTIVTPDNTLRLSGELNAFADFSPQTALRASLHVYSDSDLVRDFRSDMAGRAAEEAPAQIAFWQRGAQALWAVDAVYHQDLRFGGEKMFSDQTPYAMKPSDTIHRLGAVSWALAPVSLTNFPLRFSLELEAVNYSSLGVAWRDWGTDGMFSKQLLATDTAQYKEYDGEADGRLGTGELRRAVRLMVEPTIDIPVRLGKSLEIEGRLFHRQFVYLPHGPRANDAQPSTRGLSYASVRAFSELTRSFGDQAQFGHLIAPFIQVAGAWPGLSTGDSLQFFDWRDRLQQHVVQFVGGFDTSLYRKGSLSTWSKIINVSLFQGVDLERGRLAQMTGSLKVDHAPVSFELVLGGDWQKHLLAEVDAILGLQLPGGHAVRIFYLFLPSFKDTESGQLLPLAERTQQEDGLPFGLTALPTRAIGDSLHLVDISGTLQLFDSLSINASANLDLIKKQINWYGGGIAYNSNCRCFGWALTIRMIRGQQYPDIFVWLDLGVLGSGGTGTNTAF